MFINVTRLVSENTEVGLEKIKKATEEYTKLFSEGLNETDEIRDEYGRTAEWYQDMGMSVPDYFSKIDNKQYDQKTTEINLTHGVDFEYKESSILLNTDLVEFFEPSIDEPISTFAFLSGGDENSYVLLKDTIEELNNKINNK